MSNEVKYLRHQSTEDILASVEKFQGLSKRLPFGDPQKAVYDGVLMRLYKEMARRTATN
jgi:hypothetical protein